MALTGSETGVAMEDPEDPLSSDDPDSDADEPLRPATSNAGADDRDDEAVIAANEVAGKEFALAHRLLDQRGFKHKALLESVLNYPHEVCLLLQKGEGVGLSLAWQLMRVLHASASAPS